MAVTIDPRALYDEGEAAAILGWKVPTMQAKRSRGGGPVFMKLGRAAKYRGADLLDFIEANLATNTAEMWGKARP